MEFRNLDNASQARLESDIKTHDWTGLGQGAYDAAQHQGGTSEDINGHFVDQLSQPLFDEAKAVLPQLVDGPSTSKSVIFNGFGMSCSPQNN